MNILKNEIPTNIKPNTWVGVDTEFFGMNKKQLHRPSGTFACLTIALDHNTVLFIDKEELIAPALTSIDKCVWCIQKAMFDIVQLRRYATVKPRKKIWDTMLVELIMFGGYYDRSNLQVLSRRWLQEKVSKETRELFEKSTGMTNEMIEYSCLDPIYTLRIAQKQREAIDKDSFKIWTEIDCPAMWAFLDARGVPIDVNRWETLAKENERLYKEIDANLPFNPRSHEKAKSWYREHGFKDIKKNNKDELNRCIEKYVDKTKAVEIAKLALKSTFHQHSASNYGMNWIKKYLEKEDYNGNLVGVIHCEYTPVGAETGRAMSSSPCLTNVPTRETKEFKECFIAPDGYVMVIVDMSSQEPRDAAAITKDEYLINCFRRGNDPYIQVAKDIFQEEIVKKDPRRSLMKTIILGLLYGLSKYGLAREYGISLDEAQDLIDKVEQLLPGVAEWGRQQAKEKTKVKTISGRTVWLNPYTYQCEKNARNAPNQGTAADQVKLALAETHKHWDYERWGQYGFILYVYDELVFLFPEHYAEEGKEFVMKHMIEQSEKVVNHIVPFTVDAFIGKTWAEK